MVFIFPRTPCLHHLHLPGPDATTDALLAIKVIRVSISLKKGKDTKRITCLGMEHLPNALDEYLSLETEDIQIDARFLVGCCVGTTFLEAVLVDGKDYADLLFVSAANSLKRVAPDATFGQTIRVEDGRCSDFADATMTWVPHITDPDQTVTLSVTGLLSFVFNNAEVVPDVEIHEDGGLLSGIANTMTRILKRQLAKRKSR